MVRFVAAVLAVLATGPALAAWNEPHVEGAKPHPVLKYYPQARVYDYSASDFDSAEVVTGFAKDAEEPTTRETIEGAVTRYEYEHKPGTSPLEIVRQTESALKKAGFAVIVAGKDVADVGSEEAFGAFRLDRDGKPALYVNLRAMPNGGEPLSSWLVVEPKVLEEKYSVDADGLYAEIEKTGRVAVYGITFDTGKATLVAESEAVLAEVRALLEGHADLKLRIEGHTDNVGKPAANKKLSDDRAAAVKAWLVDQGIDAARLATAGFGDTKPVADNADEEGRAKNRRVELVRQ
ncbi:MAG TPA: OmpA family protein [Alphaproteobacteria bacterium]|nr:OmpA family protein [Alphaproteobacteria bacterium]